MERDEIGPWQTIREKFRPATVKVLLIAEAPPKWNGRQTEFFYLANSNLYCNTVKAFEVGLGCHFVGTVEFLQYFQSSGFYLEDLFAEPAPTGRRDWPTFEELSSAFGELAQRVTGIEPAYGVSLIR